MHEAKMWYYQNFDPNYVTCRACGMPFHKKKIARKRKCPHCKLDNHGCIPTPRAPDALRVYDMGEVNGVKLTYVNGNVFATPAKRR
jgi:hypothetical protein